MTRRLYYQDSYMFQFDSPVVRTVPVPEGYRVYLEATAFYPESGGQPSDRGTLGGQPVLDMAEDEAGDVYHLLPAPPAGELVAGEIDRSRRLDHMRQHTGQHLLSAAMVQLFKLRTVGFHMSQDISTVDFETESLPAGRIQQAVAMSNRIILENRPVEVLFFDDSGIEGAGLRKPTRRKGEIRVIGIEGFDRSACGGTHVRQTGETGMLFVHKSEKMKGKVRLFFTCGERTLAACTGMHESLLALSRITTTGFPELPAKMEKLLQEKMELEKECQRLKQDLLSSRIPVWRQAGLQPDGRCVVVLELEEPAPVVRQLCQQLIAGSGETVALLACVPGNTLFLGRSAENRLDLRELTALINQEFGSRGGGRPDFAQAGGFPAGQLCSALAFARRWAETQAG